MKVVFRNINGKSFEHEFPREAKVFDACNYIATQLKLTEQQVFINSPEDEESFYDDSESIEKIVEENPSYIVFTVCYKINKNEQYQSNENNTIGGGIPISKNKLKVPSKEMMNTLLMLKKPNPINPLYNEYSHITAHVPNDLQFRVKHIAQLGYQIEDCLSALRTHRYNVQQAIQSLMSLHGPINNNHNVKAARQQSTPIFH